MRIRLLLCVGLALSLSSCASWHRPDTVYRGKKSSSTEVTLTPPTTADADVDVDTAAETVTADDAPEFAFSEPESADDAPRFNPDTSVLTPPIQGVSHRTGYRGDPERARPVRKERVAPFPPGLGYIELPSPPDLK